MTPVSLACVSPQAPEHYKSVYIQSDPKTTANYDRREMKKMRKAAGSLHFTLASNDGE